MWTADKGRESRESKKVGIWRETESGEMERARLMHARNNFVATSVISMELRCCPFGNDIC